MTLAKCPFCSEEPGCQVKSSGMRITCITESCRLQLTTAYFPSLVLATQAWNTSVSAILIGGVVNKENPPG